MDSSVTSAIIFSDERQSLLIQHRDEHTPHNGKWGLFGGHSEEGEKPLTTLLRELYEELGVLFSPFDIEFLFTIEREGKPTRYVFLVKSNLSKSDFVLGEGQGFDWIPIEKVLSYDLGDGARIAIEKFMDQNS